MNVPPEFRSRGPTRGYKIARAIILPMTLFLVTYTFTSKFSVDPAKVDKARGFTKEEMAKRKAFNQAIFKEVVGPNHADKSSSSK